MNIKKKKRKRADEPNKPVADNIMGYAYAGTRTALSFIIQARAFFFYVVAFKYFMASLAIDNVAARYSSE